MTTFAQDLEQAAGAEKIEQVVIGEMGWGGYNEAGKKIKQSKKGIVLDWSEARPLLDYRYSTDYGAPECHAVYAWTPTRVLFVVQYDGSTSVYDVPRNPTKGMPEMPGG